MRWNACLRYVYNGDAGTAELHVLVVEFLYVGNSREILTNQLAQGTCASTVKNAHTRHSYKYRIVYEVHYNIQRLVTAKSTNVKVLMEV
jgi:hypothetical protein